MFRARANRRDGLLDYRRFSSLQAAIDIAYSLKATVLVPQIVSISSTLFLRSGVSLMFTSGAKLAWTGSTGGTCVETDPADVVRDCSWMGLAIDTGASFAGTAFRAHSMHNVSADRLTAITTGTTSTAFKMYADSTGGETGTTKRNITQCNFGSIVQQGQCGSFFEVGGVATESGYDGNAQVFTLNTLGSMFAQNCSIYGLHLKQWCDNNVFPGMNRVGLNGNGAIGLQVGGPDAMDNRGVYENHLGTVAVDTFGSMTGRIGIKLDRSKLTLIKSYYQNPIAEGGQLVVTDNAASYDIRYHDDASKKIIRYVRKADDHVSGPAGFNSSPLIELAPGEAGSVVVDDPSNSNQNIILTVDVTSDGPNTNGVFWCKVRKSMGSPSAYLKAGGPNFNVVTSGGALTGADGVDTKVNFSPGNDGRLYYNNRTASTVKFRLAYLGQDQSIS